MSLGKDFDGGMPGSITGIFGCHGEWCNRIAFSCTSNQVAVDDGSGYSKVEPIFLETAGKDATKHDKTLKRGKIICFNFQLTSHHFESKDLGCGGGCYTNGDSSCLQATRLRSSSR